METGVDLARVAEQMVEANGIEPCTDSFGDPADAPILLTKGLGASMLWCDAHLRRMLALAGRFVIHYDHRDTGRSVTDPPRRPGYTGAHLVASAIGVLNAHGVAVAHLVAVPAGGAFARREHELLDFPRPVVPF